MGSISNYVDLDIVVNALSVGRADNETPLILSANATFPERARTYADLDEVAVDFPSTTGPEYLAASMLFSQDPAPDQIMIGRSALKPTQVYRLAATPANGAEFNIDVAGDGVTSTEVTYTADASSTEAEIHYSIVEQLNAVTGKNYTATYTALVNPDDTFTSGYTTATLVNPDDTFTAAGAVLTAVTHGLKTGDGPFQLTTSVTLPLGLSLLTDYWVVRLGVDTFSLSTSLANALIGTVITTGDAGTGVHTISDTGSTERLTATGVLAAAAHGLETGDGPFQLTSTGTLPEGLSLLTDYWIITVAAGTFSLALSLADAIAETEVVPTGVGSGVHTISDTASTVRPGDPVTVTGDAPGEWFSLGVQDLDKISCRQTHVDPGVATDLTAIQLENPSWYALITLYNSEAYGNAAMGWIESQSKIYVVDSCDTRSCTTTVGEGDLLDDVKTLSRKRTLGFFHNVPAQMAAAGLLGVCLSYDAGDVTFFGKTISGLAAVPLTSTHRANLVARRASSYEGVGDISVSFGGQVGDATTGYLDVTRDLDWVADDMRSGLFELIVGSSKLPYTRAGRAAIIARARGTVKRAVTRTIFAEDPEPDVTAPEIADISPASKAARVFPDLEFTATMASAIHKVEVRGTVTL